MGRGEEPSFAARYAGAGVLLALVALFSALRPGSFPTSDNVLGILGNEAVSGIVALGILVPLAAGTYDLSVAGTMSLAVVQVTWLFQATGGAIPIPVAVLVVLLTAAAVGVANALLVARTGAEPFLVTLGTGTILYGLSQAVGDGETITRDVPAAFVRMGRGSFLGIPAAAVVFAVLALLLWYVLDRVPRTLSYVPAAVAAAVAGVVLAARLGSGPPGSGTAYLVPAYAAAFLGATMVRPGRVNVGGVVVAVLLLAVAVNGLQLLGAAFWVVDVVHGAALVAGVVLARKQAGTLLARE